MSGGVIIALAILAIAILYYYMQRDPTRGVEGVNGDLYEVLPEYDDHHDAARMLSEINADLIKYMRYMKNKYLIYRHMGTGEVSGWSDIPDRTSMEVWKPVGDPRLTGIVERIVTKYNPEVIVENRPGGKDTSYTIDKGRKLYMCLRDAKTHKLHDKSTVKFVMLHEIAHIGNDGWGHGVEDFWPTFKFLLWEAVNFGILKPVDYGKNPVAYCGIGIGYTPHFDKTLPNLWEKR